MAAALAATAFTIAAFVAFTGRIGCFGNLLVVLLGELLTHSSHYTVHDFNSHGLRCSIDRYYCYTILKVTFKFILTFGRYGTFVFTVIRIRPVLGNYKCVVVKKEYSLNSLAAALLFLRHRVPCFYSFSLVSFWEESLIIGSFIIIIKEAIQFFT